MINKLYPFLVLLLLFSFGCGNDNEEEEQEEMETTECAGDITVTVDGASETYGTPFSATFVDAGFNNELSELLVAWMQGNKNLIVQVVIDGSSLDCMPLGRINMNDLPSNVSILGFQYFDILGGKQGTVSNLFIEDGGDGWVDITACDGTEETISLDFEFDGVTSEGELIQIRGGSATDICFKRTK